MNYKETAERYVREKLPELRRYYANMMPMPLDAGHPIQLQHWLRAIGGYIPVYFMVSENGLVYCIDNETDKALFTFNTFGQPATEADYQAFCEIVGITSEDKKEDITDTTSMAK